MGFNSSANHAVTPLITVIVRCHDAYVKYLERALDSVLAQDLDDGLFEIVVAWDGPEPNDDGELLALYERVMEKAIQRHVRLDAIWAPEATGYYAAPCNSAIIIYSYGSYIAHLDADNEWLPDHLRNLLDAIRTPDGKHGWPDFTYSRRLYVNDGSDETLPVGASPYVPWTSQAVHQLSLGPQHNFIDSSDFLISRSVLFALAEITGAIWDQSLRRFGDYDLVKRLAQSGFRGRAVNAVTHRYHWHDENLQTTRHPNEGAVLPMPYEMVEHYRNQGVLRGENE